MKGIINLPALSPAPRHALTAVKTIPQSVGAATYATADHGPALQRPERQRQPEFRAPSEFVAAFYAQSRDDRTQSIGRHIDVKV
jgi:hypothetical protein